MLWSIVKFLGGLFHLFHIVNMSPWPLLIGVNVIISIVGLINRFVYNNFNLFFVGIFLMIININFWWRDIIRERTTQGGHSKNVQSGLVYGIILFIVSEVLFFLSFFWTFFHSSLNPVIELGGHWPPQGVCPFNPFQIPLLNTIILLSSGLSVTWCHQRILNNKEGRALMSLIITWLLGVYFLLLQGFEYYMCSFNISDSVFGSVFFIATGFHGFHVLVGTIFLWIVWMRINKKHFSMFHHFGFEARAWYWHFVDVVWLFLFSMVYWWGG